MRARALFLLCTAAWLTAGSFACGRKTGERGITIAGSTSVQPFAEKWVEAFRAKDPGLGVHVQGGGSTAGVQAVATGAAQIGMCSRHLKPDEESRVTAVVVARDGVAVVVHKDSALSDLTLAQIQQIYTGEISNWKDLGGAEAKINVITREEGSGTRGAFEELVMKDKRIMASALVQDSSGAVRQMVGNDPAAIGYLSVGLVDASLKGLRVGGVAPNEANIDAALYPLVRPFLFLVKGQPAKEAKALIDFILGPEGQAITRKAGLLPPATAALEVRSATAANP